MRSKEVNTPVSIYILRDETHSVRRSTILLTLSIFFIIILETEGTKDFYYVLLDEIRESKTGCMTIPKPEG